MRLDWTNVDGGRLSYSREQGVEGVLAVDGLYFQANIIPT